MQENTITVDAFVCYGIIGIEVIWKKVEPISKPLTAKYATRNTLNLQVIYLRNRFGYEGIGYMHVGYRHNFSFRACLLEN